MNREELLEELTEDILGYVMHGVLPQQEIAQSIKPQHLDERFDDYELLLDLHFILKPEVVEFVKQLPKQLRSIRTETETVSRTRQGTVDGHINWGATVKQRYARNPRNTGLFVCDNRSEDYDIPENLVLKKLLAVIYRTLREAEDYLRGEYTWVRETWRGNEQLIDELNRIVERNVHVRRIREPETYEPTERMLTTAANSRQAIYRDAASLLREREQLFAGEPAAIKELLDKTAITPDDENALFELFVLFRFVATLEDMEDGQFTFKTIASGRQEVARLESEGRDIVLYHDQTADDPDLSFDSGVTELPDDREPTRSEKVQTVARSVANDYFTDRPAFQDNTGRPDVIVLEIVDEEAGEYEYLITEVKNSTNVQTIRRGIKETLEYLAFLRVNDEFVFGRDDEDTEYFGSGWNGMLAIQDLPEETASVDEQGEREITILQASELETELETVLEEVV